MITLYRGLLGIILLLAPFSSPCIGQTVQAYLNTLDSIQDDQVEDIITTAALARHLAVRGKTNAELRATLFQSYARAAFAAATSDGEEKATAGLSMQIYSSGATVAEQVAESYDRVAAAAERIVETRTDPSALRRAIISYQQAVTLLEGSIDAERRQQNILDLRGKALDPTSYGSLSELLEALPVPQTEVSEGIFEARGVAPSLPGFTTLSSSVVFTLGGGVASSFSDSFSSAGELGLSTNLLGNIVGSPLERLGVSELGAYLKNNISVGTSVPTNDGEGLTAQLGLGLGGLDLGVLSLWPVLGLWQAEADDGRIPSEIVALDTTASTWSVPTFSVALLPYSKQTIRERLAAGKLVPALTFTLGIPYYYPGPIYDALAGIFNDNRDNYEQEGSVWIGAGISLPLFRLDTVGGKQEEGEDGE